MICSKCGVSLDTGMNYCPTCGEAITESSSKRNGQSLNSVIAFYIVILAFLVINYFCYQESSSLVKEVVLESIFALIMVGFALYDYKNIIVLYKLPRIKFLRLLLYLGIPFISGFVVYYGMEFINSLISEEIHNYYSDYIFYPKPMFWAILFIAIFPPIFEELGFRGFLYNQLNQLTGTRTTIILTAFIFAIVHFSVLSILWIFPFGLFLGYLRHKYNTLWIGMIIHFIHNFIVLYLDYYYFSSALFEF